MRPSDRSSTLGIAGQYDRLPSLMADLVRRHVAVIATPGSNPVSLAAKTATMQFQGEAGWLLGYPDKALASANDALILAERLNHPFSLGMTLLHASIFHQLRRDSDSSFQRLRAAEVLAADFSATFTTIAFDDSSLRRLEINT